MYYLLKWQKNQNQGLPLTIQPRRGPRNLPNLQWKNPPSYQWRDLPKLPRSQQLLTVWPSRGRISPTSPRPHLLRGKPTQPPIQEWLQLALERWCSLPERRACQLRSVQLNNEEMCLMITVNYAKNQSYVGLNFSLHENLFMMLTQKTVSGFNLS